MRICWRRVVGDSMLPTLKQDAIVIGVSKKTYKVGDIVIVKISRREVIKRVYAIADDTYDIRGDNTIASTDSRSYGYIGVNQIHAKVIMA